MRSNGAMDFGGTFSMTYPKSPDYITYVWVRFVLPAVSTVAGTLRWQRNIGHAIFSEITLTFNDIQTFRIDSVWLDIWANHSIDESKWNIYNNMIGNIAQLTSAAASLPQTVINVPIPVPHSRDSGVALPNAQLPYTDIKLNFVLRALTDLLIVEGGGTLPTATLSNFQCWCNAIVIPNPERLKLGKEKRDILYESVQTMYTTFTRTPAGTSTNLDIRFSYNMKALFWVVRNLTPVSGAVNTSVVELSNYTTAPGNSGSDPIDTHTLSYESTARLDRMGSDYFSLIQPFFHFARGPSETGYHCYAYARDPVAVDPTGGTDYSKLTVVSIACTASSASETAATATTYTVGQLMVKGLSCNIFRIQGGSFGFPAI
jgi:hypothetical protein